MQQFVTVSDTTCINQQIKNILKSWQHVSATMAHLQAKNRPSSCFWPDDGSLKHVAKILKYF
jgi:hypothetical protein